MLQCAVFWCHWTQIPKTHNIINFKVCSAAWFCKMAFRSLRILVVSCCIQSPMHACCSWAVVDAGQEAVLVAAARELDWLSSTLQIVAMKFIDNVELVVNVANMSLVFLSFFEGLGWQVDQRCLPKKCSVLQSCWGSMTWWRDVLSQAELLKDHACMSVPLALNGSASSYSRQPHCFPWTVNIRPNSRRMLLDINISTRL